MSLQRFHEAQASRSAGYDTAFAEIRRGRKTSHWIWYIFPQLAGLGQSATARAYAINDLAEACAYLRDPILRARYEEIMNVVCDQLASGGLLVSLMGSEIDALKLISSATLFRGAARCLAREDAMFDRLGRCCDSILQHASRQGYLPCARTLDQLAN